MKLRKLFLYQDESPDDWSILPRNIYMFLYLILIGSSFIKSNFVMIFGLIPAFYWTPVLQEKIRIEERLRNLTVFIPQNALVLMLLLAGAVPSYSAGFTPFYLSLLITGLSQAGFIGYFIYGRKAFIGEKIDSMGLQLDRDRLLKATFALAVSLVVLGGASSYIFSHAVDSMVEEPETTVKYPSDSFRDAGLATVRGDGSFRGTRLEGRLNVSTTSRLDTSRMASLISSNMSSETKTPELLGSAAFTDCESYMAKGYTPGCSMDLEYPMVSGELLNSWMVMMARRGKLGELIQREGIRQKFSGFTERSHFYDSFLNPGEEKDGLRAAFYSSSSGLFVISGSDNIKVNGEENNFTRYGRILHTDLKLEEGISRISDSENILELPVHRPRPDFTFFNSSYIFRGETRYDKVQIKGENWERTGNITGNFTEINVPARTSSLKFISDNRSVEITTGHGSEDSRPQFGQAFGMSQQEFERFRRLMSSFGFLHSSELVQRASSSL